MTEQPDTHNEYVQRIVRRKVGASALRKIQRIVDDMSREDQQGRKAALLLISMFVVVMAAFVGFLALR